MCSLYQSQCIAGELDAILGSVEPDLDPAHTYESGEDHFRPVPLSQCMLQTKICSVSITATSLTITIVRSSHGTYCIGKKIHPDSRSAHPANYKQILLSGKREQQVLPGAEFS